MSRESTFSKLSDRSKAAIVCAVLAVALLLLLLVAEVFVRVRQHILYGTANTYETLHVLDKTIDLRVLRAGYKSDRISINSNGFRGPEIQTARPPNSLRIAYLGGSTTYCAEVSGNEAVWPHLVHTALQKRFPEVVFDYVNGAVSGYTLSASMKMLRHRVAPLAPDMVVIYHATNNLNSELRKLAREQGIKRTSLALEQSTLAKYSLLWKLVEMNLAIMFAQRNEESKTKAFDFDANALGHTFGTELSDLVDLALASGVKRVALVTFSIHQRQEQSAEYQAKASESTTYYVPFTTPAMQIAGNDRYNEVIRSVARATGSLLIGGENAIPGDFTHFNDSVHFKDAGSVAQAKRVLDGLLGDAVVLKLIDNASARR